VRKEEESGIILRLSDEIGITPVLTARFILEAYLKQLHEEMQEDENDYAAGMFYNNTACGVKRVLACGFISSIEFHYY